MGLIPWSRRYRRGRVLRLEDRGVSLFMRFKQTGSAADLDAAVLAVRQALYLVPPGHPDEGVLRSHLAVVALSRFALTGQDADLEAAVQAGRRAVDLTTQDDPALAGRLSQLESALRLRAGASGDPADLDAVIELGRRAADLASPGDPDLPVYLSNLASALTVKWELTGGDSDLDAAFEAARRAAGLAASSGAQDGGYLTSLATILRLRAGMSGNLADLDAAVEAGRQAVSIHLPGHPKHAWDLSNLGLAFLARFEFTGIEADLDAAVEAGRQAVALTAPGQPDRAGYLSNLGTILRARFAYSADPASLDAAVDACREGADLIPAGHFSRAVYLTSLAGALCMRAVLTGNTPDLDAAVEAERRAVALTAPGQPNRAGYLFNLGAILRTRFDRGGDLADLNAAVDAGREATEGFPPGHPRHALCLSGLTGSLIARFERTRDAADLDAAVRFSRQALAAVLPGDPYRAGYLSTLAIALRARAIQVGGAADLDTAIDYFEQAVAAVPVAAPDRATYMSNLAGALITRFERAEDSRDLDAALGWWRRASQLPTAPSGSRIGAAQNLAVTAAGAGRTRASADGFAQAVALLPQVAWHGLDRAVREEQLIQWDGLAARAASRALADDRPGLAVELLEQGRSVQWTQALALRGDLTQLAREVPALAGRLSAVRTALDTPSSEESPRIADRRMALSREWDELVEQARRVDGFEDFLRPPRLERLLPAAGAGPVVIVNVSPWRCDALIVTTAGVEVKNLAGLTADEITARARGYLDALRQVEAVSADETAAGAVGAARRRDAAGRAEKTLQDVTGWLWDRIAGPVLAELGPGGPPGPGEPWPRLWWCPTGALNLLPLHAAGHHTAEGLARHESVLDHVASSYTPTLRALLDARAAGARTPAAPPASPVPRAARMLAVGLAETPGQPPLPNVSRELRLLRERFPGRHTILEGPAATWAAVRGQLPRHGWVHFSCHGDQDLADPSRGGFLLHDRPLTIADIATGQYRGDFAFLSACKTATGGVALPDEAITLAAALHYAGYRHVIGTLWSVHDRTAADVAAAVYASLTAAGTFEPGRAAGALHQAVRDLRAAGRPLSQWMPFTHTGP
jgi:hypothetical protein